MAKLLTIGAFIIPKFSTPLDHGIYTEMVFLIICYNIKTLKAYAVVNYVVHTQETHG